MNFERVSKVITQNFHFDLNSKAELKNNLQILVRKETATQDELAQFGDGNFYNLAALFEIAPAPGDFTVSGLVYQLVKIDGYDGDGHDLPADLQEQISRPLVEQIETLTYQVTQVALDDGINLNFEYNPKA